MLKREEGCSCWEAGQVGFPSRGNLATLHFLPGGGAGQTTERQGCAAAGRAGLECAAWPRRLVRLAQKSGPRPRPQNQNIFFRGWWWWGLSCLDSSQGCRVKTCAYGAGVGRCFPVFFRVGGQKGPPPPERRRRRLPWKLLQRRCRFGARAQRRHRMEAHSADARPFSAPSCPKESRAIPFQKGEHRPGSAVARMLGRQVMCGWASGCSVVESLALFPSSGHPAAPTIRKRRGLPLGCCGLGTGAALKSDGSSVYF